MRPPPIRYPLPTLILLAILGTLAWRGESWSRDWRGSLRKRLDRLVQGPPVPKSKRPGVVTGVILQRGLTLRDGVEAFEAPKGASVPSITRRLFVDVYDAWSSQGENAPAEFYRVGSRVPIGWVAARDLLRWDTRLVVRAKEGKLSLAESPGGPSSLIDAGGKCCPVVGWNAQGVQVATWAKGSEWSKPGRLGWISYERLADDSLGVLVAQVELPAILRLSLLAKSTQATAKARLQAILGRLIDEPGWSTAEVSEAFEALPKIAQRRTAGDASVERIAAINAQTDDDDASWDNQAFRFVTLGDLP